MNATEVHLSTARRRHVSSSRQFAVLLLLMAGLQLWIGVGRAQLGERRQLLAMAGGLVVVFAAMTVPRIRQALATIGQGMANPSRIGRIISTLAIMAISSAYLYQTARFQQRDFSPILHDEYCYAIQTHMLASGHLWLPKHELADFFDSFHLITDRVYAAKYGPGTALLFAPALLLHWPLWLPPLLFSGMAVGLMYLLATELFDGTAGWLAALLLISLGIFRRTSLMIMSQAPMLLLVLLAMLAFIYWRRNHRAGWMLLLGMAVGWGAITRPVDAVCIALPLALGVLVELYRSDRRTRIRTIVIGLAGVAPFLVLQLIYNKGVTGHFTKLPWSYYAQRYDPYDNLSRKPVDPAFRPMSVIPQVQQFYDEFTVPEYRRKINMSRAQAVIDRTAKTLAGPPLEESDKNRLIYGALPNPLLIVLLPVGLLGLSSQRRWALWLGLPCFILLYASYTFYLSHYAVAIAPVVILLLLAAKGTIERTWPGGGVWLSAAMSIILLALSLSALPELDPVRRDQWFDAPLLRKVDHDLAAISGKAIVLFKFDPERMLHEEPVYNLTPWPDDTRVIRAHDLGDRNRELFAYYAARSPDRMVYRFDEKDEVLQKLGALSELAKSAAASQPATRPITWQLK